MIVAFKNSKVQSSTLVETGQFTVTCFTWGDLSMCSKRVPRCQAIDYQFNPIFNGVDSIIVKRTKISEKSGHSATVYKSDTDQAR